MGRTRDLPKKIERRGKLYEVMQSIHVGEVGYLFSKTWF